MEIIELESWEEFERTIEKEHQKTIELKKRTLNNVSDLWFRGHANADWKLTTTLERFSQDKGLPLQWTWEEYHQILLQILPTVSSFTSEKYELPVEVKVHPIFPFPLGYEFMIYVRHHGFPSPMLDWSRSPYVAAFFAFSELTGNAGAAIFSFREYVDGVKTYTDFSPTIEGLNRYVTAHKRHYMQQCVYTICHQNDGNNWLYCSHEEAQSVEDQNVLKKFILPSSEREKVLRKLDFMNINAFSLFGNEEGLMDWLAYREIERRLSEGP